jgi:hypothetical protein
MPVLENVVGLRMMMHRACLDAYVQKPCKGSPLNASLAEETTRNREAGEFAFRNVCSFAKVCGERSCLRRGVS